MGWFDQPKPLPQPREAKYTIAKVEELLEQFGPKRLQVVNPQVKVLITQITHATLPYVRAQGDPPSSAVISEAMTNIEFLIQVLDGYIKIQNNPTAYQKDGGAGSLMQQGSAALMAYWQKISARQASSVQDITAYQAVTDYLSGNTAG